MGGKKLSLSSRFFLIGDKDGYTGGASGGPLIIFGMTVLLAGAYDAPLGYVSCAHPIHKIFT